MVYPIKVDDFWKIFNDNILPNVNSGSIVGLDLRVSESPELRTKLLNEIKSKLSQKEFKHKISEKLHGGIISSMLKLMAKVFHKKK